MNYQVQNGHHTKNSVSQPNLEKRKTWDKPSVFWHLQFGVSVLYVEVRLAAGLCHKKAGESNWIWKHLRLHKHVASSTPENYLQVQNGHQTKFQHLESVQQLPHRPKKGKAICAFQASPVWCEEVRGCTTKIRWTDWKHLRLDKHVASSTPENYQVNSN